MTNNNNKMSLEDVMQNMLLKSFNLKDIDFNKYSDKYLLADDENNIEKIDLTTNEGLTKYNNLVDQLDELVSGSPFFKCIIDDETIESLRKFGEGVHERANEPEVENTVCDSTEKEMCDKNCAECELDYCIHEEVEEPVCKCCSGTCRKEVDDTIDESFDIPSDKIKDTEIKLQIHRLTQKYIDEMVKPYLKNSPEMNTQVNNAYAALYEFACWIYTQN